MAGSALPPYYKTSALIESTPVALLFFSGLAKAYLREAASMFM